MANEKRLIDANVENADGCETAKNKTHFAKIIVSIIEGKPYYDILWIDPTDRNYHIGYGSRNLDFVYQWFSKYFEIVEAPTVDAVEVVYCKDCKSHHWEQEPCHGKTVHICSKLNAEVTRDFYCAAGERRE